MEVTSTKSKALVEALKLLQVYGFNGFSFQTVAEKLGIKKQSLFVHFKSKEELGIEMIETYVSQFKSWSKTIETFQPLDQLSALFDLFHKVTCDNKKYCPISALSADYNSLPKKMQTALTDSIEFQQDWVEKIIKEAQKVGTVRKDLKPSVLATHVISAAYGSQLLSRMFSDPAKIFEVRKTTIEFLTQS